MADRALVLRQEVQDVVRAKMFVSREQPAAQLAAEATLERLQTAK